MVENNKKDWEIKTLGEVCEFRRGLTYSKTDEVSLSKNAVLRANNIDLGSNSLNFDDVRYIADEITIPAAKKLVKNSVMICTASGSRSHLGKVAFIDKDYDFAFGGFMGLLIPDTNTIEPRYFYKILTSGQFRDHVDSLTAGANINNLKFSQIEDYKITVPPLGGQKRIVEVLDEKFGVIEELKQVTQQQIIDAKELFESRLSDTFSNNSNKWNADILLNLTVKIGSGATPKGGQKGYKTEGVSLVRSLNVHDKYFKYKNLAFLDDVQANKLNNVILEENDVLFNITGASIARCCLVPSDVLPGRVNQHVSILRPEPNKLRPKFLMYLMVSKYYKDILLSTGEAAGSTRQAITKLQLQNFDIKYPDIKEQDLIVKELDDLSAKTKELEAIFRRKIADLEELKKSYLQDAFAGKL